MPNKKIENHSILSANAIPSAHPRPIQPQPPPPPPPVVLPKKSGKIRKLSLIDSICFSSYYSVDELNFLRSKHGRQAIYSGKRTLRTSIPSLQDLCVETLKDNVESQS